MVEFAQCGIGYVISLRTHFYSIPNTNTLPCIQFTFTSLSTKFQNSIPMPCHEGH